MNEWKYLDMKEVIPNYDQNVSDDIGIFLSRNYKQIDGGRDNNIVTPDTVHNVIIHGYNTLDDKLIITRRRERSYPLKDHNKITTMFDEIILISSEKKYIDIFMEELKEEVIREEVS